MCELLGMSANVPTDICFSFAGLMARGGKTGPHKDGWGMAMYREGQVWAVHDPRPSAGSEMAEIMSRTSLKCDVVISHIRQANVGEVCLPNTHPFVRQLWGKTWSYAHNGQLDNVHELKTEGFQPIGMTDSELAFCWILDQLIQSFGETRPSDVRLGAFLHGLAEQLRAKGVFNMMLSEGDYLFCYCSTKLHWITRCAPFKEATLCDEDISINFSEVTTDNDIVTVIATQPLTNDEVWQVMEAGELLVFKAGEVVYSQSI